MPALRSSLPRPRPTRSRVRTRVLVAFALVAAPLSTLAVVAPAPAQAAETASLTTAFNGFDRTLYGDFLLSGNGSMRCPTQAEVDTEPVGPALSGATTAECATAQTRPNATTVRVNDNFDMRWADVDGSATHLQQQPGDRERPAGLAGRVRPAVLVGQHRRLTAGTYAGPACSACRTPAACRVPAGRADGRAAAVGRRRRLRRGDPPRLPHRPRQPARRRPAGRRVLLGHGRRHRRPAGRAARQRRRGRRRQHLDPAGLQLLRGLVAHRRLRLRRPRRDLRPA